MESLLPKTFRLINEFTHSCNNVNCDGIGVVGRSVGGNVGGSGGGGGSFGSGGGGGG